MSRSDIEIDFGRTGGAIRFNWVYVLGGLLTAHLTILGAWWAYNEATYEKRGAATAAIVQALSPIDNRLHALDVLDAQSLQERRELRTRIEVEASAAAQRFARVDQKMDRIDDKLDRIAEKVGAKP